ncbi:3-phosphoshikimate 1-carboxyvinyltransferase [Actinomarinicola tropica]|uniref:3-phosphoshikimate 1-carboxyvinyltransferase n=1 Tax=Actinomarinicola tropica TaxID=2789776 RepID=A0A5Q2RSA4_9ACTN|nr:3-phosphoshikimate 1-carboxyvinyltransferase [Actinomarinicola tropica]
MAPLERPPDVTVTVPGSKSFTNRALVLAALADGTSTLHGALVADDTEAMAAALEQLGVGIERHDGGRRLVVHGLGGRLPAGPLRIDARLSGTTARFLLPVLALGSGPYVLDGRAPLRRRPMGPTVDALRALGAEVDDGAETGPGHLPVTVRGLGTRGGATAVPADLSSQFVSGLLLAAPAMPEGLDLTMLGAAVSRPYLTMTTATMAAFGVEVERPSPDRFVVAPASYRATAYGVEPDASAASYFLAAAALTGGRVRVAGLGAGSLQGDIRVVAVLEQMGAEVELADDSVEVRGTGQLRGVDVDLADLPDMAQTIAVVAAFADGPTTVRGVELIRHHETDRIAAVVAELRRCGLTVHERRDGFTIEPGPLRPARIETYDDHRMAMSFALLGLRAPGIEIADPGCVAKTFPDYFATLDQLRRPAEPGPEPE